VSLIGLPNILDFSFGNDYPITPASNFCGATIVTDEAVHQHSTHETTVHHSVETSEPIAVTLCRATNVWPTTASTEDEFMKDQLLPAFDGLSELQFNKVPVPARDWANAAIEATLNGNPIGVCPGFEEVFGVEDHTPMFSEAEYTEAAESAASSDANGADHSEEATAEGGETKPKRKKVARGSKIKKARKASGPRGSRPLSDGKTSRIMDEVFANPKVSVEEIIANLKKEGIECTVPSTTVVRSFYRHSIKHLANKGALSKNIEF
jgi:hypothetical protein